MPPITLRRSGTVIPDQDAPQGTNVVPSTPRKVDLRQGQAWKGPHPFLVAHGFSGDIHSFNNRVDKAVNGYRSAYNKEPSPGLVWDVAKAPQLLDNDIPSLFKVPLDQRQVKAQQFHLESEHNGDATHIREDGKVQPTNMLTAFRATLQHSQPGVVAAPEPNVLSVQEFHKRYPMLMDGFTGFLPFGKTFWDDVRESQSNPSPFLQKLGYLTPKQAETVAAQGTQYQDAQAAQQLFGPAGTNEPTAEAKAVKGTLQAGAKQQLVQVHTTSLERNKVRQEWLLSHDPGGLFQGLPTNGVFDRNWMVAYDKWSRTPGAAYIQLQSVAQQNYFNPTPAGVRAMSEAAAMKQKMVNSAKNWDAKFQLETTPLRFFGPEGMSYDKSMVNNDGTPNIQNIHRALTDFWKYENTGTSWLWPVAALQGGFRFFKLGFDTMAGGFNQITADANGVTTLAGKGLPAIFEGKSTKQIADEFATAVKQNPDWIRVLGFGYLPEHLTGSAQWWDSVGNFMIGTAIAMMAKGPGYWKIGEDVPLAKIKSNPAVWFLTKLAHSNIKAGDLWQAEKVFGPGTSEKLITLVEKDIRAGKMDHAAFHELATRAFKDTKATIGGKDWEGSIFPQLRTDKLPKSMGKLAAQQLMPEVRKGLNNLEIEALANPTLRPIGAMVRSLRGMFGIASPEGKSLALYQADLPGRLESFVVNKGLMSTKDAQELANTFIRYRANEMTPQMEKLLKGVSKLYDTKFERSAIGARNDFERMLETEGLTYYRFPTGGERQGLRLDEQGNFSFRRGARIGDAILNTEDKIVNIMNKVGHAWRTQILVTGPGLFYKHLARDSVAAFMGGMKLRPTAEMDQAWAQAEQIMRRNPDLLRSYGVTEGTTVKAEVQFMTKYAEGADSYNLLEHIAKNPHMREELARDAAAHIRRLVTSKAYPAFVEASKTGDMTPLVDVILSDKRLMARLDRKSIAEQLNTVRHFPSAKDLKAQIYRREAADYAKLIFQRYKDIQDMGKAAQIPDSLDEFQRMIWAKKGLADKDIAKYLLEKDLNIRVTGGEPIKTNWVDRTSRNIITTYMKPNSFFRKRMFDHVFRQNFSEFLKTGMTEESAFTAALNISQHQTMYHMLDFSNMLQFEQRFRGFLPFFTKHRLFVKWLIARMAQHPYLAVPVHQVGQHLDPYGRLDFTFLGQPLNMNFARLFWLSSEDLPATIPGLEFVPGIRGTALAPEITRFDSLFGAWINIARHGWDYNAVTAHMNSFDVRRLDRYMATFAIHWRMVHGADAAVPESEALKFAMIRAGFFGGISRDLIWNNAYLAPVTFGTPQVPKAIQQLDTQYSALINKNPAAAREFLDKHPEVGLGWGTSQNFNVYNHVTRYWGLYDDIHSKYLAVENKYTDKALSGQALTADDFAKMHKASVDYENGIQKLILSDARSWTQPEGGIPAGKVDVAGRVQTYGPWGTVFLHDPIGSTNRLIHQFDIKNQGDIEKIYTYQYQLLEWNIQHAKQLGVDPTAVANWIDKLHSLEGQFQVTGKQTVYSAYTQAQNKYENQVFGLYKQAKAQAGYAKEVTLNKARQLILSNYANSKLTVDGKTVKVPPFAEYSFAKKTPAEKDLEIFKNMLGFSYSGMTFDQKQIIGMKSSPGVDAGWGVYNAWVADYQQQTGKEASSSVRDQLAVDANKLHPGFWRDYQIAHLPKAFILLYYAPKAFQGPYAGLWKQLATAAATAYDRNKHGWANEAAQYDTWIKANWPANFLKEYEAVGGATWLQGLIYAWG